MLKSALQRDVDGIERQVVKPSGPTQKGQTRGLVDSVWRVRKSFLAQLQKTRMYSDSSEARHNES